MNALGRCLVMVVGLGLLSAYAHAGLSDTYQVVSVFSMGNTPARISLIGIKDNRRIDTKVGGSFDGLTVKGVKTIGRQPFVQVSDAAGKLHLLSMKRPDDAPFPEGPLLESYRDGLINAEGELTEEGRIVVINNLRQIASAGQQYILDEGAEEVSYSTLEGTYFPKIKPIAGEDYSVITVTSEGGTVVVETVISELINFDY